MKHRGINKLFSLVLALVLLAGLMLPVMAEDGSVYISAAASHSGQAYGSGWYLPGTAVTVNCAGYGDAPFTGWYDRQGRLISTEQRYTFPVTGPQTLYALFAGDVYADIPEGAWYLDTALRGRQWGIAQGVSDVIFDGNSNLTRAMAAVMICRAAGFDGSLSPSAGFLDVASGAWDASGVNWAFENGVVQGRGDGVFDPGAPVLRQDFFLMVARYMNSLGYYGTNEAMPFSDSWELSMYAYDGVRELYTMGLVLGDGGRLRPAQYLSRAEAVAVLLRMVTYFQTHEPTPVTPDPQPQPGGNTITTSDGQVLSYVDVLTCEATSYCIHGYTASGTPSRYGAIAVDPNYIPLGTRMYIVTTDGSWVYGVATAEDTGGAIKGYIIDLFFDDYSTCIQFGRRDCTVYILEWG